MTDGPMPTSRPITALLVDVEECLMKPLNHRHKKEELP